MITNSIASREAKTTVVDYLRQAKDFDNWNIDHFNTELLAELADVIDYLPGIEGETDAVEKIWELCHRHGGQVFKGIRRMRDIDDDLYEHLPRGSLLEIISEREYLLEPVERLSASVMAIVTPAVAEMFRKGRPANEQDFNLKVATLIDSHIDGLRSEHPAVTFANASVVPDHELTGTDLLIESKYIRGGTSPSKASEGIAADLTKLSDKAHVLFLVYDPDRAIHHDSVFRRDFEEKGRCTICILR